MKFPGFSPALAFFFPCPKCGRARDLIYFEVSFGYRTDSSLTSQTSWWVFWKAGEVKSAFLRIPCCAWFLHLHSCAFWMCILKALFWITRHLRIRLYFENLCFRWDHKSSVGSAVCLLFFYIYCFKMSAARLGTGSLVWWNILTLFNIRNQDIWIVSCILQLNYLPIWPWEVTSLSLILPHLWNGNENRSLLWCILQSDEHQKRSLVYKFFVNPSAL